jgi:hypothetical protein
LLYGAPIKVCSYVILHDVWTTINAGTNMVAHDKGYCNIHAFQGHLLLCLLLYLLPHCQDHQTE